MEDAVKVRAEGFGEITGGGSMISKLLLLISEIGVGVVVVTSTLAVFVVGEVTTQLNEPAAAFVDGVSVSG